jgi:hypothetical protein
MHAVRQHYWCANVWTGFSQVCRDEEHAQHGRLNTAVVRNLAPLSSMLFRPVVYAFHVNVLTCSVCPSYM